MVVVKGNEYLSKQEFADAVEVSYNTITSWAEKGLVKPAYVSEKGRCFYSQEQVEAYWRGEYFPVRKRSS